MNKGWVIAGILSVVLIGTAAFLTNYFLKSSDLNPVSNKSTQNPSGNQGGNDAPVNAAGNITAGSNGTRFVDSISKIPFPEDKNRIQDMLDETSYAFVIVSINDTYHSDAVLSSLPSSEFIVLYLWETTSEFAGNATKEAIIKLQNNPYVRDIRASSIEITE